ncbi:MAG: recombination protein RecR [Rickettsiales bacterium]|nr:recombination protein RecR [Rickettsiales bacterium]
MSSLSDLIDLFSKLPSLGPRSARRIVLHLLKNKDKLIPGIVESLNQVKTKLIFCENCGNIDSETPCSICSSHNRKKDKICIVEEIGDLWAIEKSRAYDGHYHVLGGTLSAIDGVGPEDLNLKSLNKRVNEKFVNEIILATNSTAEGQITAQYIADKFINSKILITRLAQGMPMGGELDSIDNNTLFTAFNSRAEIDN